MKTSWHLLLGTLAALASVNPALGDDAAFSSYWYQGKAEITSYTLEQARYGEIHPGHAVLIYVTEDFSRRKQVKLDRPQAAGVDRVKILKLNFTKKFNTGLYPYSMMSSVFTPIEADSTPSTLKITTSSQEWCGHTFVQLNQTDTGYRARQYSYFESDGDVELALPSAIPEEELWMRARLDPGSLPIGDIRLIPGTLFLRLSHLDWRLEKATATLEEVAGRDGLMAYTLSYADLDRTLILHFKKAFPHEIEAWEEVDRSRGSILRTRATLKKRILSDYWTKNRLLDAPLRRSLGLE